MKDWISENKVEEEEMFFPSFSEKGKNVFQRSKNHFNFCERMRRWRQAQQWMVTGVCGHRDWAGWGWLLVGGHDY